MEREVRNLDHVKLPIPREIEELADFAAHDLAELAVIALRAPEDVRPHLAHIGQTMQRCALYIEALGDEDGACAQRIIERARAFEAQLEGPRAEDLAVAAQNLVNLMGHVIEKRRAQFGPGRARERGNGFQRDAENDIHG